MEHTSAPTGSTAIAEVPTLRACTRCDGEQQLSGGSHGLGKFLCDTCQMAVGFDLESDPVEFLLDRGSPSRYTKDLFGSRLTPSERRLP
jgi:hypothetical protein